MSTQSLQRVVSCLIATCPVVLACSGGDTDLSVATASNGGTSTASGGTTGTQRTSSTQVTNGGSASSKAPASTGGRARGGSTSRATSGSSAETAAGGSSSAASSRTSSSTSPAVGGKASGGTSSVGGKSASNTAPTTNAGGSGGKATGGASGDPGDAVKSPGCGKAAPYSGQQTKTLDVSGTNRSYIVRLPDNYDTNHPYRLILSIHCLNGTASGVASGSPGAGYEYYGLWKLAAGSTIFVAPQGINNSWPSGNVPFLKALIGELQNNLCIDTSRVFAEGFSMGGSMSYALACEIPDMIRGIAVHSGGPMSGCNKKNKPVAYFMTHGTKDSVCTYPGYGVPQIADFASINGCQSMDIPNTLKPTDGSGMAPVCADYQGCQDGYPTRACIFVGDHTPSPGGESKTWVPAETWKFITQF
jgi:poly(3-hydroxybutyrate) depolymerase